MATIPRLDDDYYDDGREIGEPSPTIVDLEKSGTATKVGPLGFLHNIIGAKHDNTSGLSTEAASSVHRTD